MSILKTRSVSEGASTVEGGVSTQRFNIGNLASGIKHAVMNRLTVLMMGAGAAALAVVAPSTLAPAQVAAQDKNAGKPVDLDHCDKIDQFEGRIKDGVLISGNFRSKGGRGAYTVDAGDGMIGLCFPFEHHGDHDPHTKFKLLGVKEDYAGAGNDGKGHKVSFKDFIVCDDDAGPCTDPSAVIKSTKQSLESTE